MVEKEVFKPNLNGSNEQKRMEAERRKNIPNGSAFATVNGVTAMHLLDRVELHVGDFNGTVGEFIKLSAKNDATRIKNEQIFKDTIIKLIDRVEKLEKAVERYGMV